MLRRRTGVDFNARVQSVVLLILMGGILAFLTVSIQRFVTSRVQFGADFHTFWVAGKAMFLEGKSPFAPEVTLQTQLGIYGRPPLPGEDPLGFAYPPYSLFAILPTLWMTYPWAQAFWIAFNLTVLLGVLYFAFPRIPGWIFATVAFFYPAGYGMIIGNFAVLIGVLLVLVYALLRRHEATPTSAQIVAGSLLAWITVKPQITWLLVAWFLLLAARAGLWRVWASFGATLALFLLITLVMVPGWPNEWVNQVLKNADELRYFEPLALTYAGWVLPERLAPWFGGILSLVSAGISVRVTMAWYRKRASDLVVLAWIVLLTQIVHPLILSPDQVIILLPLLLWIWRADRAGRAARITVWGTAIVAPWVFFFFPIVVMNSYTTTMNVVTRGPPFLFAIWCVWLLWRTGRRTAGDLEMATTPIFVESNQKELTG